MTALPEPPPSPSWTLWRQDDNGHRFRLSSHASEAEAQAALQALEKGSHKQTYWIEAPHQVEAKPDFR